MLQYFSYNRVFRKGPKSDNEFVNLYSEITTLKCETPLPGVLTRSLVVESTTKELSPVENAINSLEEKYNYLYDLINEYNANPATNVNPLTMALNGVIDAAVMGGMDKYQEAFASEVFLTANPQERDNVKILQDSIILILEIVDVGIGVHGRLCPHDLRPLQNRLEEQLHNLKKKNGLVSADAPFIPSSDNSQESISASGSMSSGTTKNRSNSQTQSGATPSLARSGTFAFRSPRNTESAKSSSPAPVMLGEKPASGSSVNLTARIIASNSSHNLLQNTPPQPAVGSVNALSHNQFIL